MNTIERVVKEIPSGCSPGVVESVRERWDSLTKPRGSLGALEGAVVKLAEIADTATPAVSRRGIYVFCGDHGIAAEGVSLYPSAVTREMAKNFVRGGAAINVLCRQLGIETCVVDAGVAGPKIEGVLDRRVGDGTRSFLRGPAMSREEAETAIERGIELGQEAAGRFDLAGIGEMGIGNTTAASAILCALAGVSPEDAAGRGTGLDDEGVRRKREALAGALAVNRVEAGDALGVTAAFAGFEIAMMAGFVLGAASKRLPVVADGFIAGSAILLARAFSPGIERRVLYGHRSAEKAHATLLGVLDARPLVDLEMRLGEGTGAALAMGILTNAVALYREMATFAEASVSDIEAR